MTNHFCVTVLFKCAWDMDCMMQKLNCSTNVSLVTGYKNNFVGSKHEENFQILLEKVTHLTFIYCKTILLVIMYEVITCFVSVMLYC